VSSPRLTTTNRTNLELKLGKSGATIARTRSTNRTNLELKQDTTRFRYMQVFYYQSHQSGIETAVLSLTKAAMLSYQSHQSGIETVFVAVRLRNPVPYQSHQSGIETVFTPVRFAIPVPYQSHQSGIETVSMQLIRLVTCSTNRTNLELKHDVTPNICATVPVLPIAPIWN